MTSPSLLLPSDLLVTNPHGPITTGRQRTRESVKLAHACQSPRHRAGKRGLESVSEWWGKEKISSTLFSRVSELILLHLPPGHQNSQVMLRAELHIFYLWEDHLLVLVVSGLPAVEQPEAQPWSDVRSCLSTAEIAILAEAHDAWKPKETLDEPLFPACVTTVTQVQITPRLRTARTVSLVQ